MRAWIGAACLLSAACSGHSPTAPTPIVPPVIVTPPAPTTYTIAGTVTATNGGQPLSGATVDLGGTTTTTDSSGRYTLTLALGLAPVAFRVGGDGLLSHSGYVAAGANVADFDAVRLDGTFDQTFFRKFVRNGFESPGRLESLRRWTQAPKLYIRTIDDAGGAVETRTITATIAALQSAIGPFTGGRFGFDAIEQGSAVRSERGWIIVQWYVDTAISSCAISSVAENPSSIDVYYKKANCSCPGTQTRALTMKHELGHTLGYYHTDSVGDLMFGGPKSGCDQDPSARERYHAAVVYSRPNGNTDPDNDPAP